MGSQAGTKWHKGQWVPGHMNQHAKRQSGGYEDGMSSIGPQVTVRVCLRPEAYNIPVLVDRAGDGSDWIRIGWLS